MKPIRLNVLIVLFFFPLFVFSKVSLSCIMIEGRQGIVEGLDERQPRFGWTITSDKNDVIQQSYRIIVSSTKRNLDRGIGDCWDSEVVNSAQSQWIEYKGKSLLPGHKYYIKVKLKTNKGKASASSEWSTGLLDDSNWHAEWIGTDTLQTGDTMEKHSRCRARYFRMEFVAHGKVVRATAHVSGLGYYILAVNGIKLNGDDIPGSAALAPAQTDFTKTVAYDTYDVTSLIRERNAIGVTVEAGYFFAPFQNYQTNVRVTYGLPRLRMMLNIEYADGTKETIATDKSWRMTTDGPVRYSNVYDGEMYDARLDLGPWTLPDYDDKSWQTPDIVSAPGGKMRGNITAPVTYYDKEQPVSIRRYGGRYIIDFGTNNAGVVSLFMNAAKGDTVRIRYAETLDPKDKSNIYTENLRQAQSTDYYVASDSAQWWHAHFTWHGFRYAEMTGLRDIKYNNVLRWLMADEMADRDDSISVVGNDILNKIIANARRGIRSNYKSLPIDCPQRDERMPWTGDRTTGSLGESYLMDNHDLYAKWVADFRDSQRNNGSLSDVVPAYWRLYNYNVTWPAALPFACDMLYRQYGDIKPMKESYATITKWLAYVKRKSYKDGLITYDRYGDWCVPPEGPKVVVSKDPKRNTDGKLISSCYYYYLCNMLARYASACGNAEDSVRYASEADETKNAINKVFLGEEGYANNTVTANLLPLAMDIVPDDKRSAVEQRLLSTIHDNDDHISCGVIGIQWLMRWLAQNGHGELAYKIASQKTYPGWGYMVENGATTIWELWNGNTARPSMNSGNHVMLLGDLLPWCFENLGGIKSSEKEVGFKHIIMAPDFGNSSLNGVKAFHRSPYGVISSQWQKVDGKITWTVNIPANCTAELHLPNRTVNVGSGEHEIIF